MSRSAMITAAQAPLPEAIPVVQRKLPGEIVYPFFTWLGDRWAGRRDASLLRAMLEKDKQLAVTPWLNGLRKGLLTSVARDRRDATALQAPLREEAAKLVARHRVLGAEAAAFQDAAKEIGDLRIDANPTTAGEALETPEQIQRRHQREADARVAAARDKAARAEAERDDIEVRLEQLAEICEFHEAACNYRVEALCDFYAKRQATYVWRALRGLAHDGEPAVLPEIEIPDWQGALFPTLEGGEK